MLGKVGLEKHAQKSTSPPQGTDVNSTSETKAVFASEQVFKAGRGCVRGGDKPKKNEIEVQKWS